MMHSKYQQINRDMYFFIIKLFTDINVNTFSIKVLKLRKN